LTAEHNNEAMTMYRPTFHRGGLQCITACAIATSCCIYKRCAKSMGKPKNSTPPLLPHFQPIFLKLKTKNDIWDTTPHAKFDWCGRTRKGSAKMANFGLLLVLSFFTLRVASRSHRRTDHDQWRLKTRVSAQGSAFWGLDNKK